MKSSKSSLFLMELIISILFFALASAVCIQLFVKAHLLDQKTNRQNQTVIWTQNLSSLWKACEGDLLALSDRLQEDFQTEDPAIYLTNPGTSLFLYFDSDFELTGDAATILYRIELCDLGFDDATGLLSAELRFYQEEELFYQITLKRHPALERGSILYE